MNVEFTLPVAFQEEYVSHMAPMNETIPTNLSNEEEGIEEVNEDGANEGSEEEEWGDDYEDTGNEIDVHLKDSKDDNETKNGD